MSCHYNVCMHVHAYLLSLTQDHYHHSQLPTSIHQVMSTCFSLSFRCKNTCFLPAPQSPNLLVALPPLVVATAFRKSRYCSSKLFLRVLVKHPICLAIQIVDLLE